MILRTFCPFFVFLYVKYLCLPERRFVIGYIYKKEDSDCELDGRLADDYADEIKAMFDAYTASDDTDMAEYFDGSNSAVAKIKSLKWDFESFDGTEMGKLLAAASRFDTWDLRQLINYTFNLGRITLIQNISDMQTVGVEHYMDIHGSRAVCECRHPLRCVPNRRIDGAFRVCSGCAGHKQPRRMVAGKQDGLFFA